MILFYSFGFYCITCLVTLLQQKELVGGRSSDESVSDPVLVYVGGINDSRSVGINKKPSD